MKKKIIRIFGVALTLVMVFSLAFALSPVATADPGSNKWSQFPTPLEGSDGDYIMLDNLMYLGPMEMSIDGDIWVAAHTWEPDEGDESPTSDDMFFRIFKSDDGGRSWSKKTKYPGSAAEDHPRPMDIVCSSIDNDVVYVTDSYNIYKTDDGGATWVTLSNPFTNLGTPGDYVWGLDGDGGDDGIIMAMDVGYIDEKPYIFIGTATDGAGADTKRGFAAVCEEAVYGQPWEDLNVGTDRADAMTGGRVDVWDIRVSPDFENDQMVMAVVYAHVTVSARIMGTYVTTKYAGQQWASYLADAVLTPDGDRDYIRKLYRAQIWLPDDFDSDKNSGNMEYFVGIASFDNDEGDVYRVGFYGQSPQGEAS